LNEKRNEGDPDNEPDGDNTSLDPREDGSQVVTSRLTGQDITVRVVSTDTKLTVECTEEDQSQHNDLNRQHDKLVISHDPADEETQAYDVVDVETRMTIVESQESINRQLCTEVVVFSRKHLFTHTGSDFSLEIQNSTETEISTFTTLVVFRVLDSTTSTERHHTCENIFVQVETLLSFGNTTSSVHVDGIKEIGMTVMKFSTNIRQRSSSEGTEGLFLSSSNVSEDTDVFRENVFSSTKDSDGVFGEGLMSGSGVRRLIGDLVFLEFPEDVSDLETFLEIIVLVGIDKLQVFTSVKDNGVILVIGFTVSKDRVSGQFDSELGPSSTIGQDFRVTVNQSGEDSGFLAVLSWRLFVEVGNLQVGISSEQELGILMLFLVEFRVSLHRNDKLELSSSHSIKFSLELISVAAKELNDLGVLDSVEKLDSLGVVHETRNSSVESLSTERSPNTGSKRVLGSGRLETDSIEGNIIGLLRSVLFVCAEWVAAVEHVGLFRKDLGVFDEIVPFNRMKLLEIFEKSDSGVLVFLSNDFSE
jgi:hypothetical protein